MLTAFLAFLIVAALSVPILSADAQARDRAQRLDRLERMRSHAARSERQRDIERRRASDQTRRQITDDRPATQRADTRPAAETDTTDSGNLREQGRNDAVLYLADRGYSVRRGEILALNISDPALKAAKSAGMTIVRERALGAGNSLTILRSGNFDDPAAMIARLQAIDPAGLFTPNHVYAVQGELRAGSEPELAHIRSLPYAVSRRVGIIDGRIDMTHPLLGRLRGESKAFTNSPAAPSGHAMAVALRMADVLNTQAPDLSVSLYAASVMMADGSRWAAADALSAAIAWQTQAETDVLNISLAGPPNPIVQALLSQYQARGGVVVAAVGNGGPLSMEIYPAAYQHVIGVTAIDDKGELYPYATRGSHVDIAAPGMDLKIPGLEPERSVSGTSFAAPYISACLLISGQTEADLHRISTDLGPPGRDDLYGWGALSLAESTHLQVAADR